MTTAAAVPLPDERDCSAITFDEIVRQHQRRVYRVLYLMLRDSDAADTLTQECFLRAYQKRSSFRGECTWGTWLLRIAVNLARDHSKNRKIAFWKKLVGLGGDATQEPAEMQSHSPSPERSLLMKEQVQAVWKTVDSLSDQQRSVFLLRFVEEMSLEEVAGVLGIQVGTVKAQLFRATGKVRQALKEKS